MNDKTKKTHNLGCTQSNFLVVFLVLGLDGHSLNALVDLLSLSVKLLDSRASGLSFDLAGLVLLLEFLLHIFDGVKTFFELGCLHLLFTISDPLFVIFLKLLVNFGPLLFNQEGLVLIDPFLIKIFVDLEEGSTPLLLQGGIQVEHHLLEAPLLISKSLDLLVNCQSAVLASRPFAPNLPARPSSPWRWHDQQ